MDLDRHSIERRDFSAARRGYDPDEVDAHLRELAESVTELKRSQSSGGASVAGAAAEQVRTIVEAAEHSAAQIQQNAETEASRITDDASRKAREAREKADAEAAAHVERVEEATRRMQERAEKVQSEVDDLIDNIRSTASTLVDNLRGGSGTLQSDLEALRGELSEVRSARPDVFEQAEPSAAEGLPTEAGAVDGGGVATDEDTSAAVAEEAAVEEYDVEELEAEPEVEELEAEPEVEEPEAAEEAEVVEEDEPEAAEEPAAASTAGSEGARLIALNMALNGTPRDETAKYLSENFDLADQDAILDEVYERAGGG